MRVISETSDVLIFGIELVLDKRVFGARQVAVRFGRRIVGIEWGEKQ
jgi:hypothetical protein